jgi:hypothetical protein
MVEIKDIHDLLYKNKLEQFKSSFDYVPHMTVGWLSYANVINCNDKFSTLVKKISVEIIAEHDESIIIIEHELNKNIDTVHTTTWII